MENKLYNIMRREQERHPEVEVRYSEQYNSIQYISDEGVLTVVGEDNGGNERFAERFYYRRHDEENVGRGYCFKYLYQRGHGSGCITDVDFLLDKMPYEMAMIAQDWEFKRNEMNVDFDAERAAEMRKRTRENKKNNYER